MEAGPAAAASVPAPATTAESVLVDVPPATVSIDGAPASSSGKKSGNKLRTTAVGLALAACVLAIASVSVNDWVQYKVTDGAGGVLSPGGFKLRREGSCASQVTPQATSMPRPGRPPITIREDSDGE